MNPQPSQASESLSPILPVGKLNQRGSSEWAKAAKGVRFRAGIRTQKCPIPTFCPFTLTALPSLSSRSPQHPLPFMWASHPAIWPEESGWLCQMVLSPTWCCSALLPVKKNPATPYSFSKSRSISVNDSIYLGARERICHVSMNLHTCIAAPSPCTRDCDHPTALQS